MDWKEIQEKSQQLQADGKTEEEAAEMLKDEIGVFAKDCVEHPEKMVDLIPEIGKAVQDNPMASLLYLFILRQNGGWGCK